MTRFHLPPELGGHPVRIAGARGDGSVIAVLDSILTDGLNRTEIHIAREHLVESGDQVRVVPDRPCPNVSFYGRHCVLSAHGWQQPCRFELKADDRDYDLTDGSTLKDLLEALTAGGTVAVSAAMRWVEYRLYRRAVEAEETFGAGHILTQDRRFMVEATRGEQETVMRYLTDRAEQNSEAADEL